MFGDSYNTRITVTFIDSDKGTVLDTAEFAQEYLPESFERPMSLFINSEEWFIISAHPTHANEYSFDKKLTLWIKNPKALNFTRSISHPSAKNIEFGPRAPGIWWFIPAYLFIL